MFKILFIPIIVVLLSQFVKLIIDSANNKFSWRNLNAYGGMPSSHSAAVSSLCTVVALSDGIYSVVFIISLIFSVLIIRDAVGIRGIIGLQSKAINMLVKDLPDELESKYNYLEERVGHTLEQAIAGILFGIILSYIFYTLI